MKFPTLLSLLTLTGLVAAGPPPKPPKPPGTTYLYTVNITGGATYPVGPGPYGNRLVVPILNGTFSGPRLKGTVMPVGGEWGVLDTSHPSQTAFHIDVRQTFKTDDGAYIQVIEGGSSQPDGSAFATMRFDTGSEKYYWMNNIVAFGVLRQLGGGGLTIDCWMFNTPPATAPPGPPA
ncbi:hypothetical protein QBC37DRAFT_425304 [Rhypophila decipiens]|uniref:Uncharacterized protein n=1 Tax=Rhypophila decipiens TaxID=261697 RepID=A0AAN7B8S1_9PEZI|nr:hypothetical protein QBC37DRAFT_425304 [Rhypophila decipiens]